MAKGKRNRRRRDRGPKARPAGPAKDLATAELQGALRRAANPHLHDPAGVLSARQVNPPRVVGHVTPEVERAITE